MMYATSQMIGRVKAGDPITEGLLNRIVDRLWPFANIKADGPYLTSYSAPWTGTCLHLAIPGKTAARLTSNSSPYSWEEVDEGPNGTWVTRTVGGNGTNNAFEINNVSGLAGKVYWLTWTAAGDYRFQAIRLGAPAPCETGRLCLTIDSDGCAPATPVYNADVSWTDDADPPAPVGSCTTTGVVTAISLVSGGSGYTNGTGYPLGISGDGSGASGTFDVVGGVVTNLSLADGGSNYTSATVSFPGTGSGATATATVKGRCCIDLPQGGTYHASVHVFGATDRTATINAICGQDNHAVVNFPASTLGTFCVSALKCGVGRQDVEVTVSTAGEPVPATGFTDADGNLCFRLGAGTDYTYTASVGSATFSGAFTIVACETTNRLFSLIGDYYFQVLADENCSGTFTLHRGFDSSGPVIFTQSVTFAPDGFGSWESPVYHETFADLPNGEDVYFEIVFPAATYSGIFRLGCTSPTTIDTYFAPGTIC